ncbi:MAG TPA: hypothetical protein PK916_18080, partial [Bacteroidota bacterium]|nr:hypothetical protein [Bacteroidota bacterium]
MITISPDLPVREGFDTSYADKYDLYMLALTPDGRRMRYATYIGGSDHDVSGMTAGATGLSSRHAMRSTDSSAHILCNTRSLDFPMLSGGYQPTRPSRLSFGSFSSATALLRLDTLGRLTATTWLGHPTAYNGVELWLDSEDNVLVYGQSEGAQDFVTKGTLLDSLPYTVPTGDGPDVPHQVVTVLKLRNDYSRVVTGTYLFPNKQGSWVLYHSVFLRTDSKDNIILVHSPFMNDALLEPIQPLNEWRAPGDPKGDYLIKMSADMSRLLIVGRVNCNPRSVVIDNADGIVLAGYEGVYSQEHLVRAMSSEPSYNHIIRFSATGGEPVFSTYHPFDKYSDPHKGVGECKLFVTPCNDILILTDSHVDRKSPLPFKNPLDTVNIGQSVLMLAVDTTGQHIRHLGYWHIDERYTYKEWNSFGFSSSNMAWHGLPSLIDAGGNLVFWAPQSSSPVDSITPLRSFEEIPLARGTEDWVLVRTRVPGCELLSCGLDMVD